jgi:hypothetical protein
MKCHEGWNFDHTMLARQDHRVHLSWTVEYSRTSLLRTPWSLIERCPDYRGQIDGNDQFGTSQGRGVHEGRFPCVWLAGFRFDSSKHLKRRDYNVWKWLVLCPELKLHMYGNVPFSTTESHTFPWWTGLHAATTWAAMLTEEALASGRFNHVSIGFKWEARQKRIPFSSRLGMWPATSSHEKHHKLEKWSIKAPFNTEDTGNNFSYLQ